MTLTLSTDELHALTGYRRGADQLRELHRLGFWRARRSPTTGAVILEREHYAAVVAGGDAKPARQSPTPRLRLA